MALTPDGDVDLGPICIGQTKGQPFSIIANADAPFEITAISSPDAPYSLTKPPLPATIKGAGGGMLMFNVTAAPTAPGVLTSTMIVTTDIPGGSPREIRLSATALSEGVAGTPDILDLGSQPLDVTTIGQEVSVANCTTSPVTLSNARIEGIDAASFAIVQQPMTGTVTANGVAKWLVVFTPRAVGQKTATFSVDYEGGTTSIMLAGEGLGEGVVGGGGGPPSYYACSTGGAAGASPLLLVLALLLRRRRR